MSKFPIADKLYENPAAYCATLAITQDIITGKSWPQLARPDDALRNGTLTFVKSKGRTFGITCRHVVEHYRNVKIQSGDEKSHSMRTMLNGFYIVQDRFIFPTEQLLSKPLDIAIREISPDHISHIGKQAIDLDTMREPAKEIRHAYAIGFPEKLKCKKYEPNGHGYRISLPQVEILAELNQCPEGRFTVFSEIEKLDPTVDYSGLSGGPIFWSSEDEFGILGITYEGGIGSDGNSIYVYGEIATPDVIRDWIKQCG